MEIGMLPVNETLIHKLPRYGNDSFFFEMKGIRVGELNLDDIIPHGHIVREFAEAKNEMFQKMSIEPSALLKFATSIPSCRNVGSLDSLERTNYRYALRQISKDVYSHVYDMRKVGSRRCVLNFANPIADYSLSEKQPHDFHKDISCLSQIMIYEDLGVGTRVTVVYRASDMAYDFLVDFYTLLKYVLFSDLFLDNFELTWMSNTCQFHNGVTHDMENIFNVFSKISKKVSVRAVNLNEP